MSGVYGRYPYMSEPYLDEAPEPLHYNALKKIWPVNNLTGVFEDDLHIDGAHLDEAYYQASDLLNDIFPDASMDPGLLPSWERIWGASGEGTVEDRRAEVISLMRMFGQKQGRLNSNFYIQYGALYGYTVSIYEGWQDAFLVGITQLPHVVVSQVAQWYWVCTADVPLDERTKWEYNINQLKPAYTAVIFQYS